MAEKTIKFEVDRLDESLNISVVMYTGRASRREISAKDWASIGASGQPDTAWGWENHLMIPIQNFSEAALKYLQGDPGFTIVVNG